MQELPGLVWNDNNELFNKESWPFTPLRFVIDNEDVTCGIKSIEKQLLGGKGACEYSWSAHMEDQEQRPQQHAVIISRQF